MRKKVNWILGADVAFHRVADRRILRLIQKWLRAGAFEEGKWAKTELGTAQGGCLTLLVNIYLH